MFELLKDHYISEMENRKTTTAFYIANGFCESWATDNKTFSDEGLKRYSTETRWNQYVNGVITREKAIEYAVIRNNKEIDKKIANKINYIDYIAAAPDISFIRVEVEWRKNNYWGWNPAADVTTDRETSRFFGRASGCGYDKRSAAVASAFNSCPGITKILYTLEENMLKEEKNNRRELIGYGSGYGSIPYFEGGVGVECFWHILKNAGFECHADGGKTWDIYRLEKVNK